jgi:2-dehydropantoate 2-reductase
MKICIFGAGAVGGYLGARLAAAGADVSMIARGAHLAAIRTGGLGLDEGDGEQVTHPHATDEPAELGPQDAVIVTLKAHAGPAAAAAMAPLLGPETAVVTAVNGIPWWYFHALDGPWRDHHLQSVDRDENQWREIGPERAIGCVVHGGWTVAAPGRVRQASPGRLVLGEPSGHETERLAHLDRALRAAGLETSLSTDIRGAIWHKLWGNMAFNPISALTGASLRDIAGDEGTRAVARAMMVEAEAVAGALGVELPGGVDDRIEFAASVGAHKTSMLQDLERSRPLELDALSGAVAELGRLVGEPTPTIDMIHALTQLRAGRD